MPIELVRKVIDEASSPSFPYKVQCFQTSENGDALLNKDFVEILRYIRAKFPQAWIEIFTNFYLMNRDISEVVLKENLLNHVTCNIDGHDEESYFAQKHLPLKVVEQNIRDFLEVRKELGSKTKLDVLTLPVHTYLDDVHRYFGRIPQHHIDLSAKGKVPLSSHSQIVKKYRPILGKDIPIFDLRPGGWAERDLVNPSEDQSRYECPNLNRLENEAFIAPNGDWYACCYDDQQQLTYGNLNEQTLVELHGNSARSTLIEMLRTKRYSDIGPPCNTVKACQLLNSTVGEKFRMLVRERVARILGIRLAPDIRRFASSLSADFSQAFRSIDKSQRDQARSILVNSIAGNADYLILRLQDFRFVCDRVAGLEFRLTWKPLMRGS
jgi:hypothetical protein